MQDCDDIWVAMQWANTLPVRLAVEAVGFPDGSTEWLADFYEHVMAVTDLLGEIRQLDGIVDEITAWRGAWEVWHDTAERTFPMPRKPKLPQSIIRALSSGLLDMQHAVWLLGLRDADELLNILWPQTRKNLERAAELIRGGKSAYEASTETHVNRTTLRHYMRATA